MQPALAPRLNSVPQPQQDHVPSDQILRHHLEHATAPQPTYSHSSDAMSQPGPSSPPDPSNSADNLGGSEHSDGGDNPGDGRKGYGKRELSTSKRAAQNRAAQRAFRQRKEGYIKKLEEQVRDYQVLSENFKAVQAENSLLRNYIINLQSRLLESQGEIPPPPSNVDGLQPGKPNQSAQTPTLPRLHELGTVGQGSQDTMMHDQRPSLAPPVDSSPSYYESSVKRSSAEMTPAQAALQGPSILSQQSPTTTR